MPIEVKMPKLGLTMEQGTVVEWLKAEGDAVKQGQPLFVLETDKLTLEAEAPASGTLGQILIPAGTTVSTGTAVGLIYLAGEVLASSPEVRVQPANDPVSAKHKATPVARRLAEEAGLDIGSLQGTGRGGRVTSGDVERAMVGLQAKADSPSDQPGREDVPKGARQKIKASPRARRLAEEAGLDLASVEGTGRGGRVMASDVERAIEKAPSAPMVGETRALAGAHPVPSTGDTVPFSGVRGVIAARMFASAQSTAAVTTTTQADATELVRLRQGLSQEWQAEVGLAPSYNDLLLAILTRALAEFPYMNAHIVGEEIHYLEEINIGLAVDTERGLIVPVVPGVQRLTLQDLARTTQDLVRRAREGKLLPDELGGGTFTLSNLGSFDVEASTPIINLPECAILGVGRIGARPAVFEGELCVRQTVTLSLTYDHRAIDGAPAARFLERLKALVEQPALALVR
jgi:pyruvate dehydrogenase E2 component (dihydrolipoamide acetyltransferase)